MERNAKIFVAGHNGMVGAAIVRNLERKGFANIVKRSRAELELLNQRDVNEFFASERIDYVLVAAAKVGGILFNQRYQADFLHDNVTIAANIIHAAAKNSVKKLLFLGSSCIYPKMAPQPIKEEYLLTGPLEPSNEGYALAKIVGLKLCEKYHTQYGYRFISAMPTNLYGPNDNFHPEHSHVIPGLLRRFHEAKREGAKEVIMWGTGSPRREFLHVDDLAEALFMLMERYEEPTTINVGTGEDVTILELAKLVREIVGFQGEIKTDPSKPDGTPRKVLDVGKIKAFGWQPAIPLRRGLVDAYAWAVETGAFKKHYERH